MSRMKNTKIRYVLTSIEREGRREERTGLDTETVSITQIKNTNNHVYGTNTSRVLIRDVRINYQSKYLSIQTQKYRCKDKASLKTSSTTKCIELSLI